MTDNHTFKSPQIHSNGHDCVCFVCKGVYYKQYETNLREGCVDWTFCISGQPGTDVRMARRHFTCIAKIYVLSTKKRLPAACSKHCLSSSPFKARKNSPPPRLANVFSLLEPHPDPKPSVFTCIPAFGKAVCKALCQM